MTPTDPDTTTTESPAITANDTELGSIVHSNTQMDYVAQVFREEDREVSPDKEDYAFGCPVYAMQTVGNSTYAFIGVIYDARLVDPDQGRSGPRLSAPEQEMFVPGYVNEKQTLLGIALLGTAQVDADVHESSSTGGTFQAFQSVSQDMPRWTLDVDDFVYKLSEEGFRQFHVNDGQLRLEYYERLLSTAGQFGPEVVLTIVDRLREVTTADPGVLEILERNIRWQSGEDRGVVR